MNKRMASFFLLLFFLSGYGYGQTDKKIVESKFQSEIKFEEDKFDFGTIKEGAIVSKDFHFKNTGDSILIVSNVLTTCGCAVVEWSKDPIKPGETGVIKVRFNSAGKPGRFNKVITILSNSKNTPTRITISGIVMGQGGEPSNQTPLNK